MKLYSGPLSLFSAKSRIALAEKGLAFELIDVGWSREDRYLPHHPEVCALNPNRKVPVLVDADVVVYDSTLIFEYLEDRYPDPPLYPREPALRARCRQQEAAADELWFPHVWELIESRFYPAGDAAEADARAKAATAGLSALYSEFDKELAGREYFCGDFSVADIGTFIFVQSASLLGAPLPDGLAAAQAWYQRTAERPAVAAVTASLTKNAAATLT